MNWPNSRRCRNAMNFGDRKMQMSNAAVPAMRTSPMVALPLLRARRLQALRDDLQADAARALDEQRVAGREQLADERRRGAGVIGRVPLTAERRPDERRQRTDGNEHVDAG